MRHAQIAFLLYIERDIVLSFSETALGALHCEENVSTS